MKEIKYKLKGFDLMRFTPNYGNVDSQKDIEGNFGFDFAYNSEQHTVRVLINLILKQESEEILAIEFATYVELAEESLSMLVKDSTLTLSRAMQVQFASFGYGALRGVMYLKTINTPIESIIAPPLFLEEQFKDDIEIPVK
jgi:hypothetical protein